MTPVADEDPGGGFVMGTAMRWMIMLGLTAVIAYFTSIGAINEKIDDRVGRVDAEALRVQTTEADHFAEIQRNLTDIKSELVRLRRLAEQ